MPDRAAPAIWNDRYEKCPGKIWFVPNELLQIDGGKTSHHPGACVAFHVGEDEMQFSTGTSSWRRSPGLLVQPHEGNGLKKPTKFQFAIRFIEWPKIHSIHKKQYRGALTDEELATIQQRTAGILRSNQGIEASENRERVPVRLRKPAGESNRRETGPESTEIRRHRSFEDEEPV